MTEKDFLLGEITPAIRQQLTEDPTFRQTVGPRSVNVVFDATKRPPTVYCLTTDEKSGRELSVVAGIGRTPDDALLAATGDSLYPYVKEALQKHRGSEVSDPPQVRPMKTSDYID